MSGIFHLMCTGIRDPKLAMAQLCERYLRHYRGFSYDFEDNGEREVLERIARLEPKTVFDVGANVGDWALTVSSMFPQAVIHAFELSAKTFKNLKTRVNGNRFILNNVGLADQAGEFEYKDYGMNSEVNTLLLSATFHDGVTAPTLTKARVETGDNYCREKGIGQIDFLKIDVEGVEHLVLKGFEEMLKQGNVRAVQFEYGYTNGDSKFLMRDYCRFFEAYGYGVARIQKGPLQFVPWSYKMNNFDSGPNFLAVRMADKEMMDLLTRE